MLISLNKKILPPTQAKLSVLDHGFLYGDSVYETLRTYNGIPFLLQKHLERLENSASQLGIAIPYSLKEISKAINALLLRLRKRTKGDFFLRLMITRGIGEIGLDPELCGKPNLILYGKSFSPLPPEIYNKGVKAIISKIQRVPQKAVDPNIKSGNFLNNILAYQEAKAQGCFEAFMLNVAGFLTEGTTTNLFIVTPEGLVTPAADCGLLRGITRSVVMTLARSIGVKTREAFVLPRELYEARECFITSTTKEIVPVIQVNGQVIGDGKVGMVTKKVRQAYQSKIPELLSESSSLTF